ncbi:hypothetical protein RhiirA4_429596 [Rhizophagus irregularis]|uniref:Uncharacterized protein n=1 Tax=Rhizophagus irregularis TaxID=588596 RepID=A0A2I1HHD6_9GLOM|nr:hypothetical protein RhiirA4_429596 [Rhizophagus irregularis]
MNGHVTPDKVIDITNNFRKKVKTGEVPVSEEDISLYNKVNQVCSSHLPEIKKEEILENKIGQKRCSKEELSRGSFSSDETDEEIGSENIATIVAKKEKSAQGGKVYTRIFTQIKYNDNISKTN